MMDSSTTNAKQAMWVALGRFFSFAIGILTPMVFSRFFTKADYGTYKQVMYVYSTLLVIFSLGLPQSYSYFIPKYSPSKAKDIIDKITALFLGLGLLFSITLFLSSGLIADLLNNDDLETALKVFSPAPLLLLPTLGLDGIFASFRKTHLIAIYTLVTKLLTIVCMLIPVLVFDGNYIHALIGFDIASLASLIFALIIRNIPVKDQQKERSGLSYKDIFKFTMPLFRASIWGVIIASANQFFISRYYGSEVFAEFSNGFQEFPFAAMVVAGIGTVLFPLFSGMDNGKNMTSEIYGTWISSLIKSAKIIFPMLVFSIFSARLLMTCLYSNIYENSTIYFQIKNISSLLYVIPFSPIVLAIGKTKQNARVHCIVAILVVTLEYAVVKAHLGPIAIAIVSEVCQVIKLYLLMRIISDYSGKSVAGLIPIRQLLIILAATCIAGCLSSLLVSVLELNKWLLLVIAFLAFVAIYYALCWIMKISYKDIIANLFIWMKKSPLYKLVP